MPNRPLLVPRFKQQSARRELKSNRDLRLSSSPPRPTGVLALCTTGRLTAVPNPGFAFLPVLDDCKCPDGLASTEYAVAASHINFPMFALPASFDSGDRFLFSEAARQAPLES